ncbi:hypothetical protein [Intestinicryptomonas porci]|uniref:Uncharacterized protein n=1 Tax=Intestinicryptomonas porci TaxID=2926320 RepID=A0ABU4WH22_9BACT|nr:hypothetical protein [Opitutales bacterium CLA-KB-P66]
MSKEQKRREGIAELHSLLKNGIEGNITLPMTINSKQELRDLVKLLSEKLTYNLNYNSSLKIMYEDECLNNQSDDFQEIE